MSIYSLAIPTYCDPASAPTLSNANTTIVNRYVYNRTYFTCDQGFISDSVAENPYFVCLPSTPTSGIWSVVNHTCVSKSSTIVKIRL